MDIKFIQMKTTEEGISIDDRQLPFEIKRTYYMYNIPTDARRGFHAHKNTDSIFICISGSCRVLLDDGTQKQTVLVDDPTKGLYLHGLFWREMFDFTPDCVIMVLASQLYDEDDYIRDYNEFLIYVGLTKMSPDYSFSNT